MAILIEPPQNELSALQNLSDSAGFLKKLGDGNYSIDNNNYLPLSGGTVTNELSVQHISQSGATWTSTFSAFGIDLGQSTSADEFSFIDFHSGGALVDFDARIQCTGGYGNGENRGGSLKFLVNNLSFITGDAYNPKIMTIDANGNVSVNGTLSGNGSELANLNASNIATGTLNAARLPDSGVTAGTYNNSATQVRPFAVDAKGRITSVGAAVTITPAWASITGKPTTLSGYGISRRTGWTAPTGTASRATFATSTVTVSQLAERVKALIDDLMSHGLIGA